MANETDRTAMHTAIVIENALATMNDGDSALGWAPVYATIHADYISSSMAYRFLYMRAQYPFSRAPSSCARYHRD
jgi:hypothetical protein